MACVYLLGAGPGDPGLLTLKAKRILETADVVVYDYLANKAFLNFCRPEAEILYVGKKGGDHTLPQDKINDLLVEKAKAGKVVARLKGGDPYVFGRGAEEAEELLEAGMDFEIVPGVTSAVAGPAYAGIPLTHRKYASSVSFITGHEDPDKPESAHNWQALAAGTSTLVFFMGVKNLPHISSSLIANGMDPETPAALVRWGTTCEQTSLAAPLHAIAEEAQKQGMRPPALLVVGQVVRLRETLGWFEKKPMLGCRVVVTRAREQASSFLSLLEEKGACCLQFPTIAIEALSDYGEVQEAIGTLGEYDWLIFTSVNGVIWFWKELQRAGLDSRALGGRQVAAIGPATADKLREKGIEPDFVPEKYVAEHVVEGLLARGVAGKKVLLPRAEVAREVLPRQLREAGTEVRVLPVYRTGLAQQGEEEAQLLEDLQAGKVQYVTFTSSSTVENFFSRIPAETIAPYVGTSLRLACIGPITANTLQQYGFTAQVEPEEYTIPALAQALEEDCLHFRGQ